jgi:hypothetical protein
MIDPFRIELVERDGVIRCENSGRLGFVEPICPVCNEPIAWVLDMFSFSNNDRGTFTLTHARCAWTKNGFRTQERLAQR